MSNFSLLCKGSYNYIKETSVYATEKFSIHKELKNYGNYKVESETNSRIDTGELLTIKVTYSLTSNLLPQHLTIKKNMGVRHSLEEMVFKQNDKTLHYSFRGQNRVTEYDELIEDETYLSNRYYPNSPSIAVLAMMFYGRKLDPMMPTIYHLIGSSNFWVPKEKIKTWSLKVETQSLSNEHYNFNGERESCTYFHYQQDFSRLNETTPKKETQVLKGCLSQHYQLPYELQLSAQGEWAKLTKLSLNEHNLTLMKF